MTARRVDADVSVIVAAYQAAGTIGRTLLSISAQTLKPREVMVVDDGSTDDTAAIAEAFAARMSGIRLRVFGNERNLGAGAARNRAIRESTQPFLAFLDADDEWLPEKLARSMARLEGSGLALVAHDYVIGNGDDAPRTDCARRFREGADPYVQLYRRGYIASCSVVARREAVLAAGGFDESLRNAQDFDLWLAMLREPRATFEVFGEALLRYHPTPGGIMSHTARRVECAMLIARRYFPDLKTRPGSALLSLWFRVAAIYMEAFSAYMNRGSLGQSLICACALPIQLMTATLACLVGPPSPRGLFLDGQAVGVDGGSSHPRRDRAR